jgi:hypothetical protein
MICAMSENQQRTVIIGVWKIYRTRIIFAALAFGWGSPVFGGAYLPLIGPPPLRFQMALHQKNKFVWTSPAVNQPAITALTGPQAVISTNLSVNVASVPPPNTQPNVVVPSQTENLFTNSTVQPKQANELLVVTPEMLVDYFKPNSADGTATNSNTVRVLAPVNFTPPASASIPSSQAVYQSQ